MLYRIRGRLRRLLGGGSKLTGSEDFDGSAAFVAHARRRHMTRRLPLFAAVWLGVAVGRNVVLCLESLLTPLLAVLILAVQAAVVGGAIPVAPPQPAGPRGPRGGLGACPVPRAR